MMTYKGYAGRMTVDPEAGVIHGRVVGLRDVITFEAESAKEAGRAFRESVDDYLAFCEELGRPPEKPYSGTLNARLGPDLHRRLAILAEAESVSINEKLRQIAEHALRERFGPARPGREAPKTTRAKVAPKSKGSAAGKTGGDTHHADPTER